MDETTEPLDPFQKRQQEAEEFKARKRFLDYRGLTPTLFGIIVLLFFFSFMDIKCNGLTIASVTGVELATGYKVEDHQGKPNVFAALAFLTGFVGFGLGFMKARAGSISQIICGFLGGFMLICLFAQLQFQIKNPDISSSRFTDSMKITVEFAMAYWFCLLLFLVAGILGIIKLRK